MKNKWFLHSQHGYALVADNQIVTGLIAENVEVQNSQDLWQKHKSRLHVNAGCGAICGEEFHSLNDNWKKIPRSKVPVHIQKDFKEIL